MDYVDIMLHTTGQSERMGVVCWVYADQYNAQCVVGGFIIAFSRPIVNRGESGEK